MNDPYRECVTDCTHDLAGAVLLSELLSSDGPHPQASVLLVRRSPRPPAGPILPRGMRAAWVA